MSRGFVKEEDQEEAPFIPPRAALPQGVTNYVTPLGYQKLLDERVSLEQEIKNLSSDSDKDKRLARAVINGKLELLNERIISARTIDPKDQTPDEVRFGARVTFEFLEGNQAGNQQTFSIVGVDEANINQGKIGFLAPLSKALTGKRVGEVTQFQMAGKLQKIRIVKISY